MQTEKCNLQESNTQTVSKALILEKIIKHFGGEMPCNLSKPVVVNVPPCIVCGGLGWISEGDPGACHVQRDCPACGVPFATATFAPLTASEVQNMTRSI